MAGIETMPWLEAGRESLAGLWSRGAHGLLLHGPAGIGKWDLAMSFARDVLCESPEPSGRACARCSSCLLEAAGNHPDLRVVVPDALAERRPGSASAEEDDAGPGESASASKSKPSREIRIDQVRGLDSLTGVTAHRGGARVVVLGPAESLNLHAANALLKGLEEPPPATLFLIVSDHLDACLPTIVSRCALLRMAAPARSMALAWLRDQGLGEDADLRLTEAGGAPLAVVRPGEESLDAEMQVALLAMLRRGTALTAAEIAAAVPRNVPIRGSVALFQRWGWDYFAYRTGAGLRYHPQETASFAQLARGWSVRAAAGWLDRLTALRRVAGHPLNARLAIEGVLLDYLDSMDSPDSGSVGGSGARRQASPGQGGTR